MPLEHSLSQNQAMHSVFAMGAMPLALSHRQMLAILQGDLVDAGTTRIVRQIICRELCGSVLNLVRLPATQTQDAVRVLLCPEPPGNMSTPRLTGYVIHENREVRYGHCDPVAETADSGRVHWQPLRLALDRIDRLPTISDPEWRALRRAEAPHDLQQIRRGVWEQHVRRLRLKPRPGRSPRVVENSARYFDSVTDMVVTPLLGEIQEIERQLIKAFLFPMHKYLVRPRALRRPTNIERRRNRQQATNAYPFLEDIWYRDPKVESPLANSLISRLDAQEKRLLRSFIEGGAPILGALCRFLALDPWMIDHLRLHWQAYFQFDRCCHPDRQWDVGAALAFWTPETAPRTLEELHRLHDLFYRFDGRQTPFFRTILTPISPKDRRRLRQIVTTDADGRNMKFYLGFLDSLCEWIAKQYGQSVDDDMPHLLRVESLDDWWVMAQRWHAINVTLQRSAGNCDPDRPALIRIAWPPLLRSTERIDFFTFKSIDTYAGLLAESAQMQNCASTYGPNARPANRT